MPSQEQLRWSQLRVGITVIVASIVLGILIFLISGTSGPFASKLTLKAYFQSVEGLRVGSAVSLQGVNIGNVKTIKVVQGRKLDPIEVTMKVDRAYDFGIHKDSVANLATAGVLGELFVNIDSKKATGPKAEDGDVLKAEGATSIEDIVKAGQGTLQNVDVLVKRLDTLLQGIERGEGSVGKVLKDPALFDKAAKILDEVQRIVDSVNNSKGSIGKLLNDDALYNKVNTSVDKVNKMIGDIDQGKGTVGKLLKDEELYKNANQTIAKANALMDDINSGKGTLGMLAKDPAFKQKIDDITTSLQKLTADMQAGQGSVGKLFKDPSLYNNADQMLVETRNLVKAVRENPKKYLTIHFKLF